MISYMYKTKKLICPHRDTNSDVERHKGLGFELHFVHFKTGGFYPLLPLQEHGY